MRIFAVDLYSHEQCLKYFLNFECSKYVEENQEKSFQSFWNTVVPQRGFSERRAYELSTIRNYFNKLDNNLYSFQFFTP